MKKNCFYTLLTLVLYNSIACMETPTAKPCMVGKAQVALPDVIPYSHPGWTLNSINELFTDESLIFANTPRDISTIIKNLIIHPAYAHQEKSNKWLESYKDEKPQDAFDELFTDFIYTMHQLSKKELALLTKFIAANYRVNVNVISAMDNAAPIIEATKSRHELVVQALIDSHADVNIQDDNGLTALHYAAMGNLRCAKALLKAGARTDIKDKKGNTFFGLKVDIFDSGHVDSYYETTNGSTEIVSPSFEKIIKTFRFITDFITDGPYTNYLEKLDSTKIVTDNEKEKDVKHFLAWLIRSGRGKKFLPCLHLFSKHNPTIFSVTPESYDPDGNTFLILAVLYNDENLVADLLNTNAKSVINNQNPVSDTALILASKYGYISIVNQLLAAGANIEIQNRQGNTALHGALIRSQFPTAHALIKAGADVNSTTNGIVKTAPIILATIRDDFPTVQLLIEHGARLDLSLNHKKKPNKPQRIVFHELCHLEVSAKIFEYLLKNGGSQLINTPTVYCGRYPLHLVVQSLELPHVKLLLEHGAQVDVYGKYDKEDLGGDASTPLMYAAEKTDAAKTQLLIEYGANVNAQDKTPHRHTALHACILGANSPKKLETLKILLANGANPYMPNADGKTPIDLAKNSTEDIYDFLVNYKI